MAGGVLHGCVGWAKVWIMVYTFILVYDYHVYYIVYTKNIEYYKQQLLNNVYNVYNDNYIYTM